MLRSLLYSLAALGCLGLAVAYHAWTGDRMEEAPAKAPVSPTLPKRPSYAAPSAPAPAYTPPAASEAAKALERDLATHPVVTAKRKDLDARIAQGDAVVAETLKGCLDHPQERNRVVDAVVVLRGIDTPAAREALTTLCRKSSIARMVNSQLSRRASP